VARQRLVTRGFDDWRDGRQFDLQAPPVTVADRGIWHDSGTKLSRRQSATMAGASADQTRVRLAVPHQPPPRCLRNRPKQAATANDDV
jgi:hypothetical protein